MRTLVPAAVLVSLPLCAIATSSTAPTTSADMTAEAVVRGTIDALRKNDIKAILNLITTAEERAEIEGEWKKAINEKAPGEEELAQFSAAMSMLTADGAEDMILAMIKPQLAEFAPQVEMMSGMLAGLAGAQIQQSEDLSEEDKQASQEIVNRLGEFLAEVDLGNEEKARKAVGFVCQTARGLKLTTFADLQKLSWSEVLGKAGIVLKGVKELLAVYGISIDAMLDAVEIKTVESRWSENEFPFLEGQSRSV